MTVKEFIAQLEELSSKNYRSMPWRQSEPGGTFDAYKILVSEMMLQQTQVNRVIPKFEQFITHYPTVKGLADSTLAGVMQLWVGLGYNRRAKFLHESARKLATIPEPWNEETLLSCPGIGTNTARAILAYAYDQPVLYVETNIRTVLLHHFFDNQNAVSDAQLLEQLERVVPWKTQVDMAPRHFYWAMMDYGAFIKQAHGNPNAKSMHFTKQSTFHGSTRQLRGKIIRSLLQGPVDADLLKRDIGDDRFDEIVDQLEQEKLLLLRGDLLMLYNGSQE